MPSCICKCICCSYQSYSVLTVQHQTCTGHSLPLSGASLSHRGCVTQTAVHSSAQMHKRILRFQHLNRDQGQVITQQETDIDSQHHAINQLQSVIACQERADLEQKKIIAMQGKIIAALHTKMTKSQSMQQRTMPLTSQTPCKVLLSAMYAGLNAGGMCACMCVHLWQMGSASYCTSSTWVHDSRSACLQLSDSYALNCICSIITERCSECSSAATGPHWFKVQK